MELYLASSFSLLACYVCLNVCEQRKKRRMRRRKWRGDTKNGCSVMEVEEEENEGRGTRRQDRRKISRGTHGRSVLVAGGWRIGRVAMAKRAGVFSGFGGVRPNGKPPFGKFVASLRRTMPRCRRFSSAWLIDSATNQRPRCSSTSSSTLYSLSFSHTEHTHRKTHSYTLSLSLSPLSLFFLDI